MRFIHRILACQAYCFSCDARCGKTCDCSLFLRIGPRTVDIEYIVCLDAAFLDELTQNGAWPGS